MERSGYVRVLKTIEERNLNKFIDFLRSVPLFSNWLKHSIAKLTYYFTPRKYIRNSIVYQTGDDSRNLYIVNSGEFKETSKIYFTKEIDTFNELSSCIENKTLQNNVYSMIYTKENMKHSQTYKEIIVIIKIIIDKNRFAGRNVRCGRLLSGFKTAIKHIKMRFVKWRVVRNQVSRFGRPITTN